MAHPRLSVSEMCTYPWPFADELVLWDSLDLGHVGVLDNKLAAYGREQAVSALTARSLRLTTVITNQFELAAPATWDATRDEIRRSIDLAAVVGGCVYLTPGTAPGRSFDELTQALADAVAPCLAHAATRGVRVAIEPTQRTDRSFVHTLRDAVEVADRTGLDLIVDLGNCWREPDLAAAVRHVGDRLAAAQLCDVLAHDRGWLPAGTRVVPGDGDMPVDTFLRAVLDTGYTGPFELELVGPAVEAEGLEPATRRAVDRANAFLEKELP
ncbi:sugar phosphate isomerase/epimerase [Frankia sp. AgB1.9]|uniref:sugar phosphate isomerase/epimerase family protein n=2 Tax=Frankia TaxID=1854 RepID=UPI0019344A69|nr:MULTISPECIES: sugar phosphate isomerase/epimerase family protein [unclassified Frankia]MBL7546440.1 sugar phosphate isomerase/epimerase [Frankia sp. AgB1.9]MBL7620301.1 sugar phosphate isomerase/epimerase [Frankia sp. AgB1.8]